DADIPERLWPGERFATLAQALHERGLGVAIVGAKAEKDVATAIIRAAPQTKNLVSRTDLFQLAALAERAAAVVGADSGAMHVAAAAGAPCVVLYSKAFDDVGIAPRGRRGVLKLLAPSLVDLPVEDVLRAIGNFG